MALTDATLRNAKGKEAQYKLYDGGGLYVIVTPTGRRWWRLKYAFHGKEKTLSLGVYPAVSLLEARRRRDAAKALLSAGDDPSAERRRRKSATVQEEKDRALTFEAVTLEWFARKTTNLSEGYRRQILARLEANLFPAIGTIPMSRVEPGDILSAVRPVEERGSVELAHRLVQFAGRVCRYARLLGYATYDASAGLHEALQPIPPAQHRAALVSPQEIGHLLQAIDAYSGDPSTRYALKLLPYTFLRSGELRGGRWEEIDLDAPCGPFPPGA